MYDISLFSLWYVIIKLKIHTRTKLFDFSVKTWEFVSVNWKVSGQERILEKSTDKNDFQEGHRLLFVNCLTWIFANRSVLLKSVVGILISIELLFLSPYSTKQSNPSPRTLYRVHFQVDKKERTKSRGGWSWHCYVDHTTITFSSIPWSSCIR